MKAFNALSYILVINLLFNGNNNPIDKAQTVNPVLGDISFIQKYGFKPDATTDEDLRIKTHLQFVEHLLEQKDMSGFSKDLQQKRKLVIALLHDYWTQGIFPRNYDFRETRKPCFIDVRNRICAVGYLIEKTAGREVAENINTKHKYDNISAINLKWVDDWMKTSGLSKEECAMIQPTYGPSVPPNPTPPVSENYISPAYGISSSLLGGLNLSLNALNGIQLTNGAPTKTVAILGLITGSGQVVLGASKFPKTTGSSYGNTTNQSRKAVSMVNIGLGTTAVILSTLNLMTNKKSRDRKTTFNISSFDTPDNNPGFAFGLTRKL